MRRPSNCWHARERLKPYPVSVAERALIGTECTAAVVLSEAQNLEVEKPGVARPTPRLGLKFLLDNSDKGRYTRALSNGKSQPLDPVGRKDAADD